MRLGCQREYRFIGTARHRHLCRYTAGGRGREEVEIGDRVALECDPPAREVQALGQHVDLSAPQVESAGRAGRMERAAKFQRSPQFRVDSPPPDRNAAWRFDADRQARPTLRRSPTLGALLLRLRDDGKTRACFLRGRDMLGIGQGSRGRGQPFRNHDVKRPDQHAPAQGRCSRKRPGDGQVEIGDKDHDVILDQPRRLSPQRDVCGKPSGGISQQRTRETHAPATGRRGLQVLNPDSLSHAGEAALNIGKAQALQRIDKAAAGQGCRSANQWSIKAALERRIHPELPEQALTLACQARIGEAGIECSAQGKVQRAGRRNRHGSLHRERKALSSHQISSNGRLTFGKRALRLDIKRGKPRLAQIRVRKLPD